MCLALHVVPTEEIQVLQNYKNDDENTASTSGESDDSNSASRFKITRVYMKRNSQV